jgi:hypothetical protein
VEHPDFISDVEVGVVEIDAVGVGIGYVWGDELQHGGVGCVFESEVRDCG